MTKSESGIVNRGIAFLAANTFPAVSGDHATFGFYITIH